MTKISSILYDLIKINSSSSEKECFNYIVNFLRKTNFNVTEQVVDSKKNIIATKGEPQIVLAGHMDTVSFSRSEWGKAGLDPLNPVEKDGKIYGRGSVDMKGGLAVMLKIAEDFKGKGLVLLFTVEEETTFKGIDAFVRKYKNKPSFKPKLFIFLEPTDLRILNRHKGLYECRYVVGGKTAHSSKPELGNNPSKLMIDLFALENEMKKYKDDTCPTINFGNGRFGLKTDNGIDMTHINSVPDIFEFSFDIRTTKLFEDKDGIRFVSRYIEDSIKKRGLHLIKKQVINNKPSLFVGKEKLKMVEDAFLSANQPVDYLSADFYTEAGIVKAGLGIDAINIGPSPSEMAHQVGEYVEESSLKKLYTIISKIVNAYTS